MATTKIEATNRELLEVFRGLESVKQIKGARFSVLVGKNLKELRHKLEPLEKAAEPVSYTHLTLPSILLV